jgi:hypothetical protein
MKLENILAPYLVSKATTYVPTPLGNLLRVAKLSLIYMGTIQQIVIQKVSLQVD